MSDVSHDTSEVYRIKIPVPFTELTLGKDARGFLGMHLRTRAGQKTLIESTDESLETELSLGGYSNEFNGLMARVGSGNVFISAGGGVFGKSTFSSCAVTQTAFSLVLSGLKAFSDFGNMLRFRNEASYVQAGICTVKVGLQVYSEVNAGLHSGLPSGGGSVNIYGDTSVALFAPLSVNTTGLLSNDVNAGLSAAVFGMVSTTVGGGLLADLKALSAATVSGEQVTLVGIESAIMTARQGTARVEGKNVQIGAPSGALPGFARVRGGGGFTQPATTHIRVEADDEVQIAIGKSPGQLHPPSRLLAKKTELRLESKAATLCLDATRAALVADKSALVLGADSLTLSRLAVAPKTVANTAYAAADEVRKLAIEAAALAREISISAGDVRGIGALGAIAAMVVAAAATPKNPKGPLEKGEIIAAAAAGTGIAAMVAAKVVSEYLLASAHKLAVAVAEAAHKAAYATTAAAEAVSVNTQLALPTQPKIEIKDDSIVLSVGLNKLTIDANGITLAAPVAAIAMTAMATQCKVNGNVLG